MEVENLGASGPEKYLGHSFLKLYDWRYATQLRRDHRIDPWTQSHEDAYREFVENGDAAEFIATLDDETDDELWETAQNEPTSFNFLVNYTNARLKPMAT